MWTPFLHSCDRKNQPKTKSYVKPRSNKRVMKKSRPPLNAMLVYVVLCVLEKKKQVEKQKKQKPQTYLVLQMEATDNSTFGEVNTASNCCVCANEDDSHHSPSQPPEYRPLCLYPRLSP